MRTVVYYFDYVGAMGRRHFFAHLQVHHFAPSPPPPSPMHSDEPTKKRIKVELQDSDFDHFIKQIKQDSSDALNTQIDDIFDEFHDILAKSELNNPTSASDTSPKDLSPFELNETPHSSITSSDEVPHTKPTSSDTTVNSDTVLCMKKAMADSSRLIGTFTTLKATYLKLCKEFNYLLSKFNENEKIKIELIHENNQLRKLLVDTIKEKELDRKKYRAELDLMRT